MKENIIAGRKPVIEYLQREKSAESVHISSAIRGDYEKTLRKFCKANLIPYKVVPKTFFQKYKDSNHQGVIAFRPLTKYYTIDELMQSCQPKGKEWMFLLLEGVTDVRNLGAIARSAEIFGVDALILPTKNSAPVNIDSLKTSAGAIEILKIIREQNVVAAIRQLKERNFKIYGTYMRAKEAPDSVNVDGPVALVMGSEEKGISSETFKLLDHGLIIPQVGKTESLNVSVATGICLYEFLKKRQL